MTTYIVDGIPYDEYPDDHERIATLRDDRDAWQRVSSFLWWQHDVLTLKGHEARLLASPIVYAWFRGREALYVGMSRYGLLRCLDPKHGALRDMQADDELRVWTMPSIEEAVRREEELICELRPTLNKLGKPTLSSSTLGPPPMRERCITSYEGKYFSHRAKKRGVPA